MPQEVNSDGEAVIEVLPYDPAWPKKFEEERDRLQGALEPWLSGPIEHVGSTAVAGLLAKPVIDIMAPVEDLDSSRPAIEALKGSGYRYFPYKADQMHWFCKPSPAHRTHHLHLIPYEGPLWRARLAFRDALRSDPDLAARYARLKEDLARKFRLDREAYTDAKAPFIKEVLSHV